MACVQQKTGRRASKAFTAMTLGVVACFAAAAQARSVFLNGVDVSSSRSQELRNVQVRINDKGDIFISAPHYQVTEEDFFTPLSRVAQPPSSPATSSAVATVTGAAKDAGRDADKAPAKDTDKDALKEASKEAPRDVAPVAKATSSRGQDSGNFSNSNIGAGKVSPESLPPVLEATPPATGTTPASK